MTRKNRSFSPQEKVRILKRHLVEREPISAICQDEEIAPTQFYGWQKIFFEQGAAAFSRDRVKQQEQQASQMHELESKLQRKNEVIAQLTETVIDLKKGLGEI